MEPDRPQWLTAKAQLAPINRLIRRGLLPLDYELMLEHTYRRLLQPGDHVIDIGAYSGRHLFPLADLVGTAGRIAAFEPLPAQFADLKARYGDRPNLELFNLALSNFSGRSTFTHAVGAPGESGLKQRTISNVPDPAPQLIEVGVATLDAILGDWLRLDYAKLDIEGGELDCLDGGRDLITRCRPLISVEFGYPSYSAYNRTPRDLLQFVKSLSYRIFDIFCVEYVSDADFLENVDGYFWDFFLVPREKRDWFVARAA
jgi:FkbM family methyltransferase